LVHAVESFDHQEPGGRESVASGRGQSIQLGLQRGGEDGQVRHLLGSALMVTVNVPA